LPLARLGNGSALALQEKAWNQVEGARARRRAARRGVLTPSRYSARLEFAYSISIFSCGANAPPTEPRSGEAHRGGEAAEA
jgi:hypothetical protein